MTTLIVGATGATGRLLVKQLLEQGQAVKVIVRSPDKLPEAIRNHPNLSVVRASLLDLSDDEMVQHVNGCEAVASCLGHNVSLKGIYGQPRKLVTDATRRLCQAIKVNQSDGQTKFGRTKFVLMNTTGNHNPDCDDPVTITHKTVIRLLRLLLPPHVDNEQAAEHLRSTIGQNDRLIEWVVVRPDGLVDLDEVTTYDVHPSPTRDPLFDAGKTSRINVGHFMAELITNDALWQQWKGQMPVIYNKEN